MLARFPRGPWRTGLIVLVTLGVVLASQYAIIVIGGLGSSLSVLPGVAYLRGPEQEAQQEQPSDDAELPPDKVEKYINVYKAMQRDHGLTVEQAAGFQGLTLGAFREIESKVERDDLVRERVRQALANKSPNSAEPTASRSPKAPNAGP
jgi:hypothetical protein